MAKKKKGPSPPMTMKADDIKFRRKLLEKWGPVCIVCGREFANLACITKEHVVPKSMGSAAAKVLEENLAPSHYQCNNLRGSMSFVKACNLIDEIETKMKPSKFIAWLNKQVPHRIVPPEALAPIRKRQFMELPEYLPGM